MALDRWIAFIILLICITYAYTAFFTMDGLLPPIMQRSPIWPSSFPKVLSIGAILMSLAILLGVEKAPEKEDTGDITFARLREYKLGQAIILLSLMVAYALLLRPIGFLAATFLFLFLGSFILGERRFVIMGTVSAIAAGTVWWLVDSVLGIFLSPLPLFMIGG
ncbi:MAG: tripartite tricarboxylate transporter TctB family protein [Cognatishimia sp.]|uniref:tripartite tricarboxylate transporter TctB family protein n=1 Tax=Cognatishimia sp. 1_MG-2023 TaxID=3062642 RepID=UPI0026E122BB|nr:tripartite tricarboxylate transporter TctB family protein [Cognatishimia sp. 1_MG-2023]MDO6725685.1 tripartite tricarboxylate transporter TctB family protein [Cognatishimia sp. 1_MG-2023]